MHAAYVFSGLIVGLLVGLTGVGGGSLMTPLLVFVFNVSPVNAVGTDLLFASITKSWGVVLHQKLGHIEWRVVGLLAAGSVPTAFVTVRMLEHFSKTQDMASINTLITTSIGVALILTSFVLLFKSRIQQWGDAIRAQHPPKPRQTAAATVIAGVILGVLVTMTSVGAGALGATLLFLLYQRMASAKIVGTDIAHAVPLTAVAGLGHLHMGTVDFALLSNLLIGSLPGIYLGSRLSSNLPEHVMRPVLASMLMLIGVKFVA